MQKSPILPIVLLLGILIGGGVYLLGSSGSNKQEESELTLTDTTSKQEGSTRSSGPMAGGKETLLGTAPTGEAKRSAVSLSGDSDSAVASKAQDSVTGRVVNTAGNGLGGARVTFGGPDPLPLASNLGSNSSFAKRWSTVTRTDGSFELVGPEPGELRVEANLAGFVPAEVANLVLPMDGGLDVGDLVMDVSVLLEGRVRLEGGGGIAGAELHIQDPNADFAWFGRGSSEAAATTDPDGYFRIDTLAAGPWKILVTSDDHPDRTFKGRTERPGEQQVNLEFSLEPGLTIAGRIQGASQRDLAEVEVSARPGGGVMRFGPGGGAEQRKADVAADGTFVVRGCREGEQYELSGSKVAESRRRFMPSPAVTERVKSNAGDSGVTLSWIGSTSVNFQVVSASTGAPVEDFKVTFGSGWQQPYQRDGKVVTHHPSGMVSLTGLMPDNGRFRMGPFKVVIEAAGYESFERELEVTAGEELDARIFSLKSAAIVTVTALDASSGMPIEGAEVRLSVGGQQGGFELNGWGAPFDESNNESRSSKTGPDGVARLSSFEGQTGRLTVTHGSHTTWRNESFVMPAAAPVAVEVRLGAGGTVLVTVTDAMGNPKPGARVETRRWTENQDSGGRGFGRRRMVAAFGGPGGDGSAVADSNGVASFYHLEPGTHEFKIGQDQGNMGFSVSATLTEGEDRDSWIPTEVVEGGRHTLSLREEATGILSGTVWENGIGLAGAELSLKSGDDLMGSFDFGFSAGPGSGTTDGRGKYSLSSVEPGSYNLEIRHAGRVMSSSFPVEIVAGENDFDATLSIAVVEGHITDSLGNPIQGAKVEIGRPSQEDPFGFMVLVETATQLQIGSGGSDPSITNADGFYSLRGVETGADLQVTASADSSSPGKTDIFTVGEGETRTRTDLVLDPAGSMAFKISGGEDGYFMVTATYLDAEGLMPKMEIAESRNGKMKAMTPGRWSVSAESAGPGINSQESEAIEVVIKAGQESEVVIEI